EAAGAARGAARAAKPGRRAASRAVVAGLTAGAELSDGAGATHTCPNSRREDQQRERLRPQSSAHRDNLQKSAHISPGKPTAVRGHTPSLPAPMGTREVTGLVGDSSRICQKPRNGRASRSDVGSAAWT